MHMKRRATCGGGGVCMLCHVAWWRLMRSTNVIIQISKTIMVVHLKTSHKIWQSMWRDSQTHPNLSWEREEKSYQLNISHGSEIIFHPTSHKLHQDCPLNVSANFHYHVLSDMRTNGNLSFSSSVIGVAKCLRQWKMVRGGAALFPCHPQNIIINLIDINFPSLARREWKRF